MHSSSDSSAVKREIDSWGSRATSTGKQLQELTLFHIYTDSEFYSDGMSWVSLFVGPIEEARDKSWVVVGGHAEYPADRKGYEWGEKDDVERQMIASAKMWDDGDWRIGKIFLHLRDTTRRLNELPE